MVRKPNITITRGKLLGAVTGAVVAQGQLLPGQLSPGQLSPGALVPGADVGPSLRDRTKHVEGHSGNVKIFNELLRVFSLEC